MKDRYHYLESGLDNVWLMDGFQFDQGPFGKTVAIHDIEGLHQAIARALIGKRQRLTGKEFRFLRTELLLSQSALANALGVRELTVGRWEKGQSEIPVATEAAVRQMYAESVGEHPRMRELLSRIADLEDKLDQPILLQKPGRPSSKWQVVLNAA